MGYSSLTQADHLVSGTFVLYYIHHCPLYSHCLTGEGLQGLMQGLSGPSVNQKVYRLAPNINSYRRLLGAQFKGALAQLVFHSS